MKELSTCFVLAVAVVFIALVWNHDPSEFLDGMTVGDLIENVREAA